MARSALILSLTWKNDQISTFSAWRENLLARTFVNSRGENIPLWKLNTSLPYEVADLSPHVSK